MKSEREVLTAMLAQFVDEARAQVGALVGVADRDVAEIMAELPEAAQVQEAAEHAAKASGYLDRSPSDETLRRFASVGRRSTRPFWGRAFNADTLHQLGVAGLMRAEGGFDRHDLVEQLAEYLAGPRVPLWRYVVLDVDWNLPRPHHIGGWRLEQPTADQFKEMRPVPMAADYTARQDWDPLLYYGWCLVLSSQDVSLTPARGTRLSLFGPPTSPVAWKPLFLLNLLRDSPVTAVAEYIVEPRRLIE